MVRIGESHSLGSISPFFFDAAYLEIKIEKTRKPAASLCKIYSVLYVLIGLGKVKLHLCSTGFHVLVICNLSDRLGIDQNSSYAIAAYFLQLKILIGDFHFTIELFILFVPSSEIVFYYVVQS